MPLGERLSVVDEADGMKKDGGESDLPHCSGLWSPGCRGSGTMALAVLSPDLVQWPSFWPFRRI
jgi:hypothetical protein